MLDQEESSYAQAATQRSNKQQDTRRPLGTTHEGAERDEGGNPSAGKHTKECRYEGVLGEEERKELRTSTRGVQPTPKQSSKKVGHFVPLLNP